MNSEMVPGAREEGESRGQWPESEDRFWQQTRARSEGRGGFLTVGLVFLLFFLLRTIGCQGAFQ